MAKKARVLNEKELKRVFGAAALSKNPERNQLILMYSFYAGLRAKEIAALKVGDVVDGDGTIKSQMYLKPDQTKGSDWQVVYLSERIQKATKVFLETKNQYRLDQPLFRSMKTMGYFSADTIGKLLKKLYRDAGFENASSHSGRRTFITNLSEKGVEARVIQELARHAHLTTTQGYIELSVTRLAKAVELL